MLRGHAAKMPRRLQDAVEAYVDERCYDRAARRVGIARSTICLWSNEPEFRQLHDQILRNRAGAALQ